MNSYFFYYFSAGPEGVPHFEVVNCRDDADAASRCNGLLLGRPNAAAEVWCEDRMVCRVDSRRTQRRAGGPSPLLA